jgi:Ca-activated chloride channel family protein
VLLTDGASTAGRDWAAFEREQRAARRRRALVRVFPSSLAKAQSGEMQALAALTGGRAFDARNTGKSGLPLVFKEIRGYQ